MVAKPTYAAYRLMHDGAIALADIEHNGLRIDEAKLDAAIARVVAEKEQINSKIKTSPVWDVWVRKYGSKSLLTSRQQLDGVIFGELGYEAVRQTKKGDRNATDAEAFADIQWRDKSHKCFIRDYFKLAKLDKIEVTYLRGIKREVIDGFVHSSFNLHTVTTYRSSSSDPNAQNYIKDQMIRELFLPHASDHYFVESDYGAHEWRIAACRWRDPKMMEYAADPTKDVHRDTAAELFLCDKTQVSKEMRFEVKSGFVFAKLYGSFWLKMARYIWDKMDSESLKLKDGTLVRRHLAAKGIRRLGMQNSRMGAASGTYEMIVKKVEDKFNATFPEFVRKADADWREYERTGSFSMVTGFCCNSVHTHNFFLNAGVQGPGFHCLLWSIVRLRKLIKKRGMKTLLVGQVHDSILASVPHNEIQEYLALVKQVMTVDIRKVWDWICVPLIAEAQVSPLGKSWWEKTVWEEGDGGVWAPAKH